MSSSKPRWNVILALLVSTGSLAMLLVAPAFASLALALSAAIAWCIWLERHPSA